MTAATVALPATSFPEFPDEPRRSRRAPLAAVLGSVRPGRDELLLVVDPDTGRVQAEYSTRDLEGEGTGVAEIKRPTDHTCVAVIHLTLRGLNPRTEECETMDLDAAVTWSREPGIFGSSVHVAGTALAYRPRHDTIIRLGALDGHSVNRFETVGTLSEPVIRPAA